MPQDDHIARMKYLATQIQNPDWQIQVAHIIEQMERNSSQIANLLEMTQNMVDQAKI